MFFINSWFILKPHRTQSFKNSISCEDFNVQKKELTFPPRRTNEHTEILSHECLKLPLHMKAIVRGWECVRLWERLSVWDRLLLQPLISLYQLHSYFLLQPSTSPSSTTLLLLFIATVQPAETFKWSQPGLLWQIQLRQHFRLYV